MIAHGLDSRWARQSFHDINVLGRRPNAAIAISMDNRIRPRRSPASSRPRSRTSGGASNDAPPAPEDRPETPGRS